MEGANIVPVMDMNRNNNYGDCWGGGMWFNGSLTVSLKAI